MGERPLDYSRLGVIRHHSRLGVASLATSAVVLSWHLYVDVTVGFSPHWHGWDAVWVFAYDYRWLPAITGSVLACLGLLQHHRRRWPCWTALGIIVFAYFLLAPPMNLA